MAVCVSVCVCVVELYICEAGINFFFLNPISIQSGDAAHKDKLNKSPS